jgi:hypothetical protein
VAIVKSSDKNKEVNKAEKAIIEMAPKLGSAAEVLSVLAQFFPNEIKNLELRVKARKEQLETQNQNLQDVINQLDENQKADYEKYKQLLERAKPSKSSSSIEYEEANRELGELRKRMPPKLLRTITKADEAQEKYESANGALETLKAAEKNFSEYSKNPNPFETALDEAPGRAHKRVQELCGKATLSNPDAFAKQIEEEKKKCANALESFGGKDSEVGKLNSLFHEIGQYRGKSGRGKKLYSLGQALSLKSKSEQTDAVIEALAGIDFPKLREEIEKFEENVIMLNALEEALAAAKNQKMMHAAPTYLSSLSVDDLKQLGISNSVLLRTPEVLVQEAKRVVGSDIVSYMSQNVDKIIEGSGKVKSKWDTKGINWIDGSVIRAIVEIDAILEVFQDSLTAEEKAELIELRHKLVDMMEKKAEELGVKLTTKRIPAEHIARMKEHFTNSVKWKEEEVIGLIAHTYWDLMDIISKAYGIKMKDLQETLDDFVKRQLELIMLLRNYKPVRSAGNPQDIKILSPE